MDTDRNRKDATGRGGRIERIVFGVVLSLFSLAWLALTFAVDARERAARRWPEVPCTILGTETAWESTGTAPHRHSFPILRVRYRYEWNGVARESDVFSTNERGPNIERASERERWTSIYRPGAASTCLVNPDNPDEAVLHAMTTSPIPFFCVGFAGLAAGFWLLAGPRLRRRRTDPAADARPAPPPETPPDPPPDPRRFRLWFGAAFFAGGLLFAALGALWLAREAADPVVSPPWSPPPRVGAWMFTGLGALFAAVGAAIALFAAIRPRRLPEGKLPRSGRLRRAWATDRFTATLATAVAAAGMAALFRRFVPQDEAMPRLFTGFLVLFAAGNGCAALWLALRFLFARRYEIEWTNGPMVPGRPFTITYRMRDDGRPALSRVRFLLVGTAWVARRGDRKLDVSEDEVVKRPVHLPVRPEDLLRGSFELTIPASDPPPGTDEPTWTLRVRASVRGGLPVSDDYPLRPIAARERRPEQGGYNRAGIPAKHDCHLRRFG